MAEPYPPIEPYDHGMLDVGDRNLVYWETCSPPQADLWTLSDLRSMAAAVREEIARLGALETPSDRH
jgi:hypothetical protein